MSVIYCTSPKCGSQWIRDLLTDPKIAARTGLTYRPAKDVFPKRQPTKADPPAVPVERGIICGPVYNQTPESVLKRLQPEDRVIYVVRDPRDMAISWIYSMLYSHSFADSVAKRYVHGALGSASPRDRLLLAMWQQANVQRQSVVAWFVTKRPQNVLLTSYEAMINDTLGELEGIFQFIGVQVEPKVLRKTVDQHSFRAKAGREPGQEDVHSHYRKGVAGDWQQKFDRDLGERWEELLPGVLVCLGYETTDRWWESLPERQPDEAGRLRSVQEADAAEIARLNAEIAALHERHKHLERICADHPEYGNRLNALVGEAGQAAEKPSGI